MSVRMTTLENTDRITVAGGVSIEAAVLVLAVFRPHKLMLPAGWTLRAVWHKSPLHGRIELRFVRVPNEDDPGIVNTWFVASDAMRPGCMFCVEVTNALDEPQTFIGFKVRGAGVCL